MKAVTEADIVEPARTDILSDAPCLLLLSYSGDMLLCLLLLLLLLLFEGATRCCGNCKDGLRVAVILAAGASRRPKLNRSTNGNATKGSQTVYIFIQPSELGSGRLVSSDTF